MTANRATALSRARATTCSKCGLAVKWIKSKPGGRGPSCLNLDGSDHWDACSKERTRLANAEGVPFRERGGSGVVFEGKKRYNHKVAPVRRKSIPPHPEGKLPWED